MPSGVEAEVGATDGAAALDLADAADAVDAIDAVDAVAVGDESMFPPEDGIAPARGAATEAARSVAGVTAPTRGWSARVGSIQSNSPKGGCSRAGRLKRAARCRGVFGPHLKSPAHQRGDRYRRRSPIRSDVDPSRAATVRPVFPGTPPRGGRVHVPAVRLLLRGVQSSLVG